MLYVNHAYFLTYFCLYDYYISLNEDCEVVYGLCCIVTREGRARVSIVTASTYSKLSSR